MSNLRAKLGSKARGAAAKAIAAVAGEPGVFNTLIGEHEAIRALMDVVQRTALDDPVRTRDLIQEIRREVVAHQHAEETELYSVLKRFSATEAKASAGYEEHQEIERRLDELVALAPTSAGWVQAFEAVRDLYVVHTEHEEDELFPLAEQVISKIHSRQIDERFGAERARYLREQGEQ